MILKISKKQVRAAKEGELKHLIAAKKDYKTGVVAHLTTGLGKNYNKVSELVCVSTQEILIEPKSTLLDSLIEIDGVILTYQEVKEFSRNCGFKNEEEFFKYYSSKKDYTLINFTDFKY